MINNHQQHHSNGIPPADQTVILTQKIETLNILQHCNFLSVSIQTIKLHGNRRLYKIHLQDSKLLPFRHY